MFINRKRELDWLKHLMLALRSGKGINAALLGLRRIGKTELILEFSVEDTISEILFFDSGSRKPA